MKLDIPRLEIAKAAAEGLSVEAVKVGPVHVDRLAATGGTGRLAVARVEVDGAQLTLTAEAKLTLSVTTMKPDPQPRDPLHMCEVEVLSREAKPPPLVTRIPPDKLPWSEMPGDLGSGSLLKLADLLDATFAKAVSSLSLAVRNVDADSVTLVPPAGGNGQDAVLSGHVLQGITLPGLPIPLAGFGFERLAAEGLAAGRASLGEWRIAGVKTRLTGELSREHIDVSLIKGGDLELQDLKVCFKSTPLEGLPGIEAGYDELKFRVSQEVAVTATLAIDRLKISGIDLGASFASLEAEGMSIPIEAIGLVLTKLVLEQISAAKAEVSS